MADIMQHTLHSPHGLGRARDLMGEMIGLRIVCPIDGGYEILIPCECAQEDLSATFAEPLRRLRRVANVAALAAELATREASVAAQQPPERSVSSNSHAIPTENRDPEDPYFDAPRLRGDPVARLVREVFPQVCQENSIRLLPVVEWDRNAKSALAGNINKWMREAGLDTGFIEDMMWEFGRNPRWCQQARGPAWKVFLNHRADLVNRVTRSRRFLGVTPGGDNPSRRISPMETHRNDKDWWLSRTRRPVAL